MEKTIMNADEIECIIREFIAHSPENSMRNSADEKAFENPLVGFAGGNDPLFNDYKEHVGSFHWTPLEIFNLAFPAIPVKAAELTVISWILPKIEAAKADNRQEKQFPSERWVRARIFGEEANIKLRNLVVDSLSAKGLEAVAPERCQEYKMQESVKYGLASNWSERHAAYAAGLGTFGLSDGLITPRGKAVRAGSVVARVQMAPTPRLYTDHHAYCLFFSKGSCKKCMERCPVGAITEAGHDKVRCQAHTLVASRTYVNEHYGFKGHGCGLCQTGVPCESRIP